MRRGTRGCGYGRPAACYRPQHNIPRLLQPSHAAQSQVGPLMTGRLQGIKDIKMEIELLKREIIEEQVLSNYYTQRNVYEQPMFSQTREDRHDDYTRLYDNPREVEQYEGREGSRKRPHFPVFENEAPAKRFSAPNRVFKKSFGYQLGLPPNYPRPDFQLPPEFRFPTFKPYKGPPPARLFTEAMASGAARPAAVADDKLILRADREPSHLMIGRLELTLGSIMKDVKTANPQHEMLFKQPHITRAMKQCVRDRIRTAMIGKPVSTAEVIKVAYYDMFPEGSDNDIILKGLQAQQNKLFVYNNTDNPEVFFKENMRNLILLRIEEITNKLQEIYGSGANTTSKLQIDTKPKSNIEEPKADRSSKEETQSEAKPKTDRESETAAAQLRADDTTTVKATEEPIKNESETQPKEPAPTEKASVVSEKAPEELIDNKHYMALDKRLNSEMIHLINFHRFTREFAKNIEMDAMYQKTKATIIAETAKKLEQNSKSKSASNEEELDTSATANASKTQTPNESPLPMLYYAKILGKPSLPKRKELESFFSQFNPKTIKKHRTIHNLLFVGFVEKEPYEKILAADGTAIGGFTLNIKTARINKNKKNQINTNNSLINSETDKLNDSTENIADADFDQQVVDLLTSIMNSEFDNFSEDVMEEPPVTKNAVNKENRHSTKIEEVVDCDADQNANHVIKDDIIKLKDDDKDVVKIKDDTNNSSQNDKETNDASQNTDETNNQWRNNRVSERAKCHRPPDGRGPRHERVACTEGS